MTDKSAAAARELVERWMGKKHPITMQSYVSDLTALISEHYVAKEEVDKMVSERLRDAPKNCPKAAQCAHVEGGMKCPPNVICPI